MGYSFVAGVGELALVGATPLALEGMVEGVCVRVVMLRCGNVSLVLVTVDGHVEYAPDFVPSLRPAVSFPPAYGVPRFSERDDAR